MSLITPSNLHPSVTEHIKHSTLTLPSGAPDSPINWFISNSSSPLLIANPANNWHDVNFRTIFPKWLPQEGLRVVFASLFIQDISGGVGVSNRQPWNVSYRPLDNTGSGLPLSAPSMALLGRGFLKDYWFLLGPRKFGQDNGIGIEINVGDNLPTYTRMTAISIQIFVSLFSPT